MGYKVNKIRVGTKQVRPEEGTTIEYTLNSGDKQSIYKSGYKITKITVEYTCSYSTSAWNDGGAGVYCLDGSNNLLASIECGCPAGPQWGYDYGNNGRWGRIYSNKVNSGYGIVAFQSTSTTDAQASVQYTFDYNTLSYKVGKTYGNWLEEGQATFDSTWQANIRTLLESSTICSHYRGRGQNSVTAKAIVTYEQS